MFCAGLHHISLLETMSEILEQEQFLSKIEKLDTILVYSSLTWLIC